MKVEYIVSMGTVALAGVLGFVSLGSGVGRTIAADAASGARSQGMAVSRQAALVDIPEIVGHSAAILHEGSALRRLPAALQREVFDAAALEVLSHPQLEPFRGLKVVQLRDAAGGIPMSGPLSEYETHDLSVLRDMAKSTGIGPAERMHTAAYAGDVEWLAEELLVDPARLDPANWAGSNTVPWLLRTAGIHAVKWSPRNLGTALAEAGDVVRAVLTRAPEATLAVAEHFVDWSRSWGAVAHGAPRSFVELIAERALQRLTLGDLYGYAETTLRRGDSLDGGFAVAPAELPAALRTWAAVASPDAPSAALRHVMEGNLQFLSQRAADTEAHLRDLTARWQPTAGAELEAALGRLTDLRRAVASAQDAAALSKRDAYRLFDQALGLFDTRSDRRFRFETVLDQHASIFPFASNTVGYWPYADVADWFDVGTYPAEVTPFPKFFDGNLGDTASYTGHDIGHILDIRERMDNDVLGRWRDAMDKVRAMEKARGRTPLTDELRSIIGESVWEGDLPLSNLATRNTSAGALTVLAQWTADYGRRTGNLDLQRQAASVLGHRAP